MRFVPIKSAEQHSIVMLHRTRDLLVRQRTMLVNALRGHLSEFGVVGAKGISQLPDLLALASSTPGIVTLAASRRHRHQLSVRKPSSFDLDTRLLLPNPKGIRARASVPGCRHQVTPWTEMTIDDAVR